MMTTSTAGFPSDEDQTLLESVLTGAARGSRLPAEDARDFMQSVQLHLLETNYDLLRRFEGRSSLRTYLTVAIRRMLIDWRNEHYGRWRPSHDARRLGSQAVELERLIHRDGYTRDQAVELTATRRAGTSRDEVRRLAEALPARIRRRRVDDGVLRTIEAPRETDPLEERERSRARLELTMALRRVLDGLSSTDRHLLYLRFYEGRTIRAVAESIGRKPRPLYRQFERLMDGLRAALDETTLDERVLGG